MIDIEVTFDGDEIRLASDRRTLDIDGRMHITDCVLTAAQVNDYAGFEIPSAEELGLDPNAFYRLWRTPAALKAALPLFENLPILLDHVAVSAADPKQSMVCGSVSNARWQDGKIIGDLALWTAEAIDLVQSGSKRDLSVGYHYVCRVGAGKTPDGTPFDARMESIKPNHLSLVPEGRVAGAYVADAAFDYDVEIDAPRMQDVIKGYNRLR